MTEQEKMQQEALAMEALEQISGGQLTKDDVKRYWSNTKKFVSDHKVGVGAAAVAIAALAVEGGGRKFKDVKTLANAIRGFLPNALAVSGGGPAPTPRDGSRGGGGNPMVILGVPLSSQQDGYSQAMAALRALPTWWWQQAVGNPGGDED